jgi:hypothetical protein
MLYIKRYRNYARIMLNIYDFSLNDDTNDGAVLGHAATNEGHH